MPTLTDAAWASVPFWGSTFRVSNIPGVESLRTANGLGDGLGVEAVEMAFDPQPEAKTRMIATRGNAARRERDNLQLPKLGSKFGRSNDFPSVICGPITPEASVKVRHSGDRGGLEWLGTERGSTLLERPPLQPPNKSTRLTFGGPFTGHRGSEGGLL